jgi:hypothetical protein
LKTLEDDVLYRDQAVNEMYGALRGARLKAYVTGIRQTLYTEKLNEKKAKYNEAINKYAIWNTIDFLFILKSLLS